MSSHTPLVNGSAQKPLQNHPQTQRISSKTKVRSLRTNTESSDLSRHAGSSHYTSQQKSEKRKKRILYGVLTLLVLLACAGIALAFYFHSINAKLNAGTEDVKGVLASTEPGQPFYMLLMGVDKSQARDKSGELGGSYRADTIILARIDPKTPKVTLVSIHRDTLVDLGQNGQQKINAAYAIGGQKYMTEVVSQFAGVPISHYAEVDFDGFASVIDTLGGVEVNIPVVTEDLEYAGGTLQPGIQTLNAKQALFLCRARHAYDEYGDGDAFRAANQRMIIAAIIKKILKSDPATMTQVISQCANYVTTDLDVTTILTLAAQIRSINPKTDIYSGIDPTESKYVNDIWYEVVNVPAWQAMMKRVNKGLPPYENEADDPTIGIAASSETDKNALDMVQGDPQGATVSVLNATGQTGLATKVANKLNDKGFVCTADNAQHIQTDTLVIYNGTAKNPADIAAKMLGVKAQQNDGSWPNNTDIVVVIGTDY